MALDNLLERLDGAMNKPLDLHKIFKRRPTRKEALEIVKVLGFRKLTPAEQRRRDWKPKKVGDFIRIDCIVAHITNMKNPKYLLEMMDGSLRYLPISIVEGNAKKIGRKKPKFFI